MLGRLLHTAALSLNPHASNRPQTVLESTTEEAHTYSLLYPEASVLHHTQHQLSPLHHGSNPSTAAAAASFDDRGGLDIKGPRDIRIIIAQDANTRSHKPEVLYDSQPVPSPAAASRVTTLDTAETGDAKQRSQAPDITQDAKSPKLGRSTSRAKHSRHRSLAWNSQEPAADQTSSSASPTYPESGLGGAISNARRRASNARPVPSGNETAQVRMAREGREETEALLGCMFGATGFRLVSSTKLHIRPATPSRAAGSAVSSPTNVEPSSPRTFAQRHTPLARSVTAEDILAGLVSSTVEGPARHVPQPDRPSMLITRLFSVDIPGLSPPADVESDQTSNAEGFMDDSKSYPFPQMQRPVRATGTEKARHTKIAMYAVAMVLRLPSTQRHPSTPSIRREQFPTSPLQSGRPSRSPSRYETHLDWTMPNKGQQESLVSPIGADNDVDRHLDYVLGHWDIVMRALLSLERVVKVQLYDMLKQSEATSASPLLSQLLSRIPSLDGQSNLKPTIAVQPIRHNSQLPPRALEKCEHVQDAAEEAGIRVAVGLRTRGVVAGQGRWGVWREEARWVGRWAGGKEQNFFFFNLLTAFLGNHTEWLESLGPSWHRRRHTQQQHARSREESQIPHRTIVVSLDKMAARRLIFLLSAFLPATHGPNGHKLSRPTTSTPNASYSQSPPSSIPVLRQQSLRRTINRRTRGHSHGGLNSGLHGRSVSLSTQDTVKPDTHIEDYDHPSMRRKASSIETRTITGASLPIPPNGSKTSKSSTTTTSTVTPETTVPVPHFASSSTGTGESAELRPRSNGSLASLTLRHSLKRAESTGLSNSTDSHQASTWGSMLSGFWSNGRGSSTEESDAMTSSQEGLGIRGLSKGARASASSGKLVGMVDEVSGNRENVDGENDDVGGSLSQSTIQASQGRDQRTPSLDQSTPAQDIPERPRSRRLPLKLSIDNEDGIIDVELPMTGSFSSFGSPMSSGNECLTAASSFNDHTSMHPHAHALAQKSSHTDSGSPSNVAGWLKRYHEDFALQAVRQYDTLKEDVKRSMHAEPSPPAALMTPGAGAVTDGKWKDVCTTLIANTTNFSITRLRLRRKITRGPSNANAHSQPTGTPTDHPPVTDTSEPHTEEEIIEEPIMDMDPTLIDAVERVLVQSGQTSKAPSRASSRASSPRRRDQAPSHRGGKLESAKTPAAADATAPPGTTTVSEVPRGECKKMVLGALEQVVKSVTEELARDGERHGGKGRDVRWEHVDRAQRGRGLPADSTLREGVRRWLQHVEGVAGVS
ncbi:hypothetical protein MMC08_007468 [Hypocenomyce scalaris]|nr:hypothetical protein [Hypocenomyce scalaris]